MAEHETYKTLAGKSMQSLEHEIVAIERSAGIHVEGRLYYAVVMYYIQLTC